MTLRPGDRSAPLPPVPPQSPTEEMINPRLLHLHVVSLVVCVCVFLAAPGRALLRETRALPQLCGESLKILYRF